MELYARVRRAVLVEGKSERGVAREFGLARDTVRKMLRHSVPPGYRRKEPAQRPKLGPWTGVIDAILEDDKTKPPKQRHTAKRIFARLRAEHGFPGGYTIVKDYVRLRRLRSQEMFVPLTHAAGTAQVDFGEAQVIVAGVECKAHYLAMETGCDQPADCSFAEGKMRKGPIRGRPFFAFGSLWEFARFPNFPQLIESNGCGGRI